MEKLVTLETDAFNELYLNYRQRFIRFSQNYVLDETIAEDLVMDAFVYTWEHRIEMDVNENIPAYLLTVIKHKCLNYLRKERLRVERNTILSEMALWELDFKITTLSACDPYELYTAEIQEIVNRTIEKLPLKTRQIFIMSRYDNLSYPEIAMKMDMTQKAIEYHMSKALKEFRVALKDYLPILLFLL